MQTTEIRESLIENDSLRLELMRALPDSFFCMPIKQQIGNMLCWNIGFGGVLVTRRAGGWCIRFAEFAERTFYGVNGRETRIEKKPDVNIGSFEELKKILVEYYNQ